MLQTTCTFRIFKRKQDWCYFASTTVNLPNGFTKYFCDLLTKDMAYELSKQIGIEIEYLN